MITMPIRKRVAMLVALVCCSPIVSAQSAPPQLDAQVFLRNQMEFSGGRETGGASASFVALDGRLHVLTAKHLLGPAMGVEPAVTPTRLMEELEYWVVFHNDGEDILASISGIVSPTNDEAEDIILLEALTDQIDIGDLALPLAGARPEMGERVFIIGCPYSQDDCSQNTYAATVSRFEDNLVVAEFDQGPDSLAGFSGAAMLNGSGEIVAVVYGGGDNEVVATLVPGWIRALHTPD